MGYAPINMRGIFMRWNSANLAFLLPMLILVGCTEKLPNDFSAAISAKEARFFFPVGNAGKRWSWDSSPSSYCEYSWMVEVFLDGDVYEIGFSKFAFSGGATESKGTLNELLSAGQVDVWERDSEGASVVPGVEALDARRRGNGIMIQLKDPEFLNRIVSTQPGEMKFIVKGMMLSEKEVKVTPEYHLSNSD